MVNFRIYNKEIEELTTEPLLLMMLELYRVGKVGLQLKGQETQGLFLCFY